MQSSPFDEWTISYSQLYLWHGHQRHKDATIIRLINTLVAPKESDFGIEAGEALQKYSLLQDPIFSSRQRTRNEPADSCQGNTVLKHRKSGTTTRKNGFPLGKMGTSSSTSNLRGPMIRCLSPACMPQKAFGP